jgi:MFS family permease
VRRLLLIALAAAVALCFADSSIVVLALPQLMERFGASVAAASAVVTAYNLILLAALLPMLRVGRRLDPARTARAGLVVFMIASAACAIAPGIWFLVTSRAIQGLGAGLLLCASFPIARSLAATPARGSAVWAGACTLGATVGPAAGGLLTDMLDWRQSSWPSCLSPRSPSLQQRREHRSSALPSRPVSHGAPLGSAPAPGLRSSRLRSSRCCSWQSCS